MHSKSGGEPLGEDTPGMRFARYKCDITAWLWTRPDPIKKGGKRGQANLKMVKPLVKLPRLDSNQQPFG
jgi:hypothetical protein